MLSRCAHALSFGDIVKEPCSIGFVYTFNRVASQSGSAIRKFISTFKIFWNKLN